MHSLTKHITSQEEEKTLFSAILPHLSVMIKNISSLSLPKITFVLFHTFLFPTFSLFIKINSTNTLHYCLVYHRLTINQFYSFETILHIRVGRIEKHNFK